MYELKETQTPISTGEPEKQHTNDFKQIGERLQRLSKWSQDLSLRLESQLNVIKNTSGDLKAGKDDVNKSNGDFVRSINQLIQEVEGSMNSIERSSLKLSTII